MNKMHSQRGFVSIFTVLFFIIFITIITVGFLRVVVQEQQQAGDNSLTASALAAARSGIEDGKRALLLYNTAPAGSPLRAAFDDPVSGAFATQSCTGIFGNATIATALGLRTDGTIDSSSNLQEAYSCLTINPYTNEYVGQVLKGQSQIIPLRGQAPFQNFSFEWHGTASDQEGRLNGYAAGPLLPTQAAWRTGKYAAYIRLELIAVPAGAVSPTTMSEQTIFLVPGSSGTNAVTFDSDPKNPTTQAARLKSPPSVVACLPMPGGGASLPPYACNVTMSSSQFAGTSQLYLRVTSLYAGTHFRMMLHDATGAVTKFSLVEPTIDATGRTSDVFRRLQARVRLDANVTLPENALESGGDICKSFWVTTTSLGDNATCPLR